MLREAVALALDCPGDAVTISSRRGHPVELGPGDIRGSVSYTRDLVACLLQRGTRPGVDAETLPSPEDGTAERLASAILTSEERAWLETRPKEERTAAVIQRWTAKEAVAKALGVGLDLDFQSLDPFRVAKEKGLRMVGFSLGTACRVTAAVGPGVARLHIWSWSGPDRWLRLADLGMASSPAHHALPEPISARERVSVP